MERSGEEPALCQKGLRKSSQFTGFFDSERDEKVVLNFLYDRINVLTLQRVRENFLITLLIFFLDHRDMPVWLLIKSII